MSRTIDADALIKTLEERAKIASIGDVAYTYLRVVKLIDKMQTLTLNTLRDAIYEDAVAHGLWFERDDCPTTCVEMIQDEVSELDTAAMEWEDDICDNNDDFVEELADVMIMCLSVAGRLEIDIDSAVKRKMEINKARPWKHGKEEKK